MDVNGICPVCHEDLCRGQIFTAACRHVFCVSCVHELTRCGFTTCLYCRAILVEATQEGPGESIANIVLRGENALRDALNWARGNTDRVGEVEREIAHMRGLFAADLDGELEGIMDEDPGRILAARSRVMLCVARMSSWRCVMFAEKVSRGDFFL